jgi:transposase-like protein
MSSNHSSQFKQDAVKLVVESDKSVAQTAQGTWE